VSGVWLFGVDGIPRCQRGDRVRPREISDDDLIGLLPGTVSEIAGQAPIGKAAVHYRLQLLEKQGKVKRVAGTWPHMWKGN